MTENNTKLDGKEHTSRWWEIDQPCCGTTNKYLMTILHDRSCALPEIYINQVQEELTKFYSIFTGFSRNQTRSMPTQKSPYLSIASSGTISITNLWRWTKKISTGTKIIVKWTGHLQVSCETLIKFSLVESTSETVTPSKNSTNKTILEPELDVPLDPFTLTR